MTLVDDWKQKLPRNINPTGGGILKPFPNKNINVFIACRPTLTFALRSCVVFEKEKLLNRKIAEQMGVGRTQIDNVLKRKADILTDYENNTGPERKSCFIY
jgi:hypothetical protein